MLGNNEILGLLDGIRINKTNKVAIYTALTNTYDQIYAPKVNPSNLDYYLFTDNIRDLETNIWNVKKINFQYRDPRRLAKLFKIFPHHLFPNYDYSIWVDASIEILNDLNDLINEYLKNNEDLPQELAAELGLDVEKLKADSNSPQIKGLIDEEIKQMRNSGIPRLSVPKFLINGKEPQGRTLEAWSAIIDAELNGLKKKTESPKVAK